MPGTLNHRHPIWTGLRREISYSIPDPVEQGVKLLILINHPHPDISGKVTELFVMEKTDEFRLWIRSGGLSLRAEDCDIEFDCVRQSDLAPFPPAIRFLGSIREFLNAYRPAKQHDHPWPQHHRMMIHIEKQEALEIHLQRRYAIAELERFGFRWDRLSSDFLVAFGPDGDFIELHAR